MEQAKKLLDDALVQLDILSFFLLLINLVIPVFSLIVAQQIINESKRVVRK